MTAARTQATRPLSGTRTTCPDGNFPAPARLSLERPRQHPAPFTRRAGLVCPAQQEGGGSVRPAPSRPPRATPGRRALAERAGRRGPHLGIGADGAEGAVGGPGAGSVRCGPSSPLGPSPRKRPRTTFPCPREGLAPRTTARPVRAPAAPVSEEGCGPRASGPPGASRSSGRERVGGRGACTPRFHATDTATRCFSNRTTLTNKTHPKRVGCFLFNNAVSLMVTAEQHG